VPINNLTEEGFGMLTGSAAPSFTGLLDEYPNAAAAYSVRRLSSTYTGALIEVRRTVSSTTVTADVAYDSNNELSLDSEITVTGGSSSATNLGEFVAATGYSDPDSLGSGQDAFARTWYDQSGNANNATQTSASAQPKIYDSVIGLVVENGKPAIDFDGSNDFLEAGDILSGLAALNVFTVSKIDSSNVFDDIYNKGIGELGEREYGLLINVGMVTIDEDLDTNSTASSTPPANQFLAYSGYDASNVFVGIDGAALSTNTALTVKDRSSILVFMSSDVRNRYSNGNLQEAIFYDSDQSSNRTGIETNINNYYNIY